jgi:hypothetical protein
MWLCDDTDEDLTAPTEDDELEAALASAAMDTVDEPVAKAKEQTRHSASETRTDSTSHGTSSASARSPYFNSGSR